MNYCHNITKKHKKPHSWRAFNPGWLQRGADKAASERISPVHSRPIRK